MAKALTSLLLGLAACAWVNFAAGAASASCKDCNADTRLRVREQIKADRAREVDRVAKSPPIDLGTVVRSRSLSLAEVRQNTAVASGP
jgi:hypothetical protein